MKDSNSDLSKLLNSRNEEIQRINVDNKVLVDKISNEKQRIYEQLNDMQTRYDNLIDQNQGFVEFK